MEQLKQTQLQVLKNLKEMLDSVDITNVLREEETLQMPILTTLHDNLGYENNEVMGEFYFLPLFGENQKFHYFTVVMTLDEEVPQEKVQVLSDAVNMLNYYMPIGAFTVQKNGGILAYKHAGLLPIDMDTEKLVDLADGMIGSAMSLVNDYVDPFMQLLNGQITLAQFELELPDTKSE